MQYGGLEWHLDECRNLREPGCGGGTVTKSVLALAMAVWLQKMLISCRWGRGSQQLSLLVEQPSVKFKLSQNEKMKGKGITEFQAIKSLGSHSFSGNKEVAGRKAPG